MPRSVEGGGENDGGRPLPDGPVGAEHGDPGAGHLADPPAEHAEVLLVPWPAYVEDRHAPPGAGGGEFRVVVEELVEAVDDVHALVDGPEHDLPLSGGQHAARWRHPEDEHVGHLAGGGDGGGQVGADRDGHGLAAQHLAGVQPGPVAVDHRHDLVPLGVADEAVGRLPVRLTEAALAVDDSGGPIGARGAAEG